MRGTLSSGPGCGGRRRLPPHSLRQGEKIPWPPLPGRPPQQGDLLRQFRLERGW